MAQLVNHDHSKLLQENKQLKQRLEEAEETLRAIRHGEIDALVVKGRQGSQVYTLRGADHSYRVLIESMNEGAVTFNLDGVILYCNKSFAGMVNQPLERVIGSEILDRIHPPDRAEFQKFFTQSNRQRSVKKELCLAVQDGEPTPALFSVTPLQLVTDEPGLSMIVTDLREARQIEKAAASQRAAAEKLKHEQAARQEIEAREERFRTLIEQSSDAVQLVDTEGKILYSSNSVKQVLGYTPEELQGRNCAPFLHPEDASMFAENIGKLISDPDLRLTFQYRVRHKDGSWAWIEATGANHLATPNINALVGNFRNITERKELEKQKDDFIGVASHELKTPVTSMKIYTQVLRKNFEKEGNRKSAEAMAKMDAQINKLAGLIADLLDVTHHQTGNLALHMENFDLGLLVTEISDTLQLTTSRHTIEIHGDKEAMIHADRDRTGQVLINLLSNAIKYSPKADRIIVTLKKSDSEAVVSVQDFGIGIPNDKRDLVFDRFVRVGGPEKHTYPGLGLGLYISSQIVQQQKGRIWVESQANQGSTFYFALPLLQPVSEHKTKSKLKTASGD